MGEVFLAEHVTIGTRVAIKVLQAAISKDQEQVNRFFNEAKAVNKVRHAGPVKIFDCGYHTDQTNQRTAYLAMEFLEGESLASRIKRLGTLPGEQVADIGRQIAGVLDAVHSAGITHRDLKPDNIFLCPDHELPSGERVKVLDFGIAKLTGTMAGPQTKGTMGTPAYMAPEQWNNSSSVDGKADTYSLGCVMFEMAVGRPPFPSQSIGEACNHHLNSKPPRASEVLHSIPMEFDTLVDRMLSKTVDLRPTVKEVARAFDTLRTSGVTQRWNAVAVAGVAATMGPGSMPPIGSQPGHVGSPSAQFGSQPGHVGSPSGQYGSQPYVGSPSGQYGSQPGPIGSPSGHYGSQPGSQPNIPQQVRDHGSQPVAFPVGHVYGMQNPLATPVPQHHTPQHHAPQHHTPQHHTPQHHGPSASFPAQAPGAYQVSTTTPIPQHLTPQHLTPPPGTMPPAKKGNGLLIGLGALVLVGGVAVAVVATSGGSSPGPGSDKTGSDKLAIGSDQTTGSDRAIGAGSDKIAGAGSDKIAGTGSDKATTDGRGAGSDKIDKAGSNEGVTGAEKAPVASKRDTILAKNPFVDSHGVRVLSSQITAREYELVIGPVPADIVKPADPEAPLPSLTQQEAATFCAAIGARLPTSNEWSQAAKGAWGIAVDAVAGPLQEWTSTIQDELAVVRGGHATMANPTLQKAARSSPPYFLQKEIAGATFDRKIVSAPTIGFRCVDGTPKAGANVPAKPAGAGFGGGGGGSDVETIGLGKIGTSERGTGGGIGTGGGGFGTGRIAPKVAIGAPGVTGGIDKAEIQRTIKRYISGIKYCYEKALATKPDLAGTVKVKFTISGANGSVIDASATGFDANVDACVVTRVRNMKFPTPANGGNVVIAYPFVFQPG